MKKEKLQCNTAREISIIEFLKKNGFSPLRENHKEAWDLSPIRKESTPSFKVSKILNRWYDHGLGKGGNIIDLVIEMKHQCTVQESLAILENTIPSFSFQQQKIFAVLKPEDEIRIEKVLPIQHPALLNYLVKRKVNPKQVTKYAKQVHYSFKNSTYFAIGLKNVSGGWELRNSYYKNAAAPKGFSFFSKANNKLAITEGMFDFFSLISLYSDLPKKSDFIVLNSVSFVSRIKNIASRYTKVGLYLDNDLAGKKATKQLLADLPNSVDMSAIYSFTKDLNEYLTALNRRQHRL
ncbi:toprim domain-containing protein [uncultured Draconibacterium sp.]|uniref:toprim domain-containing protein n=1 Tax=uncultured Draconibacterium sp. TaxID=1573823 RepID=UPI003261C361